MKYVIPLLVYTVLSIALAASEQIPLELSAPAGSDKQIPLLVSSGIPFPQGAVKDIAHVGLESKAGALPFQIMKTAQWPDGSVKWVLIDFTTTIAQAKGLKLAYGSEVQLKKISNPITIKHSASETVISGNNIRASINRESASLDVAFGTTQTSIVPVLDALRLNKVSDLPPGSRAAMGSTQQRGTFTIDTLDVEHQGPLRIRIVIRGHVKMPKWASTLPDKIARLDPREQIPYSLRYTIYRDAPLVQVDQKIIYTGEPDKDMITRWGFDVKDQGSAITRRVNQGGITVDRGKGESVVSDGSERTCWVPLKNGLAWINDGWQNRPCELGGNEDGDARVDFWPRSAGPWDLRRYAREWATGESGNRDNKKDIEFFSQYAARGMAKSQRFGLYLGKHQGIETARAYAQPSLVLATPQWYQQTYVFGDYLASVAGSPYQKQDESIIRYLDYMIYNQDLYKWYGKLHYGFWQSRNGQVHRLDRWDRDYGRWGWALGDGAGRTTHALMFQFIRNLDRNYLLAGEAACRIVYDTSMIHTNTYMENAQNNWWRVKGSNHRHNVQAFGCPYAGMRGSYPYGHRIYYFLTGDGLIADGLNIVKEAAMNRITRKIDQALGNSGGTDGTGTATLALLHAYEQTGDKTYLAHVRKYFDQVKVFTKEKVRLGYGPSFGLFLAAAEYIEVSGDEEFKQHFLALADRGLTEKKQNNFITVFAKAWHISQNEKYKTALKKVLEGIKVDGSLCEFPRKQWPGHGGAYTPASRANLGRDLPYAWAALVDNSMAGETKVNEPAIIASVPKTWQKLNAQKIKSKLKDSLPSLPSPKLTSQDGSLTIADSIWSSAANLITASHKNKEMVKGMELFYRSGSLDAGGHKTLNQEQAIPVKVASTDSSIAVHGMLGNASAYLNAVPTVINGQDALRMQVSVVGNKQLLSECGIRLPLALGTDGKNIHLCAPGAFRIEQWRVDHNDEQIPEWLNSDKKTRWPLWRHGGIMCGTFDDYRIVKMNRLDTSPIVVDEGVGSGNWLDVSNQQVGGCSVRINALPQQSGTESSILYNAEKQSLEIRFLSSSGESIDADLQASVDIVLHDGWRPPLQANVLNKQQYTRLLNDLDYGENIGLFAYRFRLSTSHKVKGQAWKDKISARGVRASELLFSMVFRDGLATFCKKIKVPYDATNLEKTVAAVINHYRK